MTVYPVDICETCDICLTDIWDGFCMCDHPPTGDDCAEAREWLTVVSVDEMRDAHRTLSQFGPDAECSADQAFFLWRAMEQIDMSEPSRGGQSPAKPPGNTGEPRRGTWAAI